MNSIQRNLVEIAAQACRNGQRVTLDNFHSQAGKTPRASAENADRAAAENRAGRFRLTVYDSSGSEQAHAGVSREDARKLVAAGAEFVGQPWRAP